MKNLLLVSLACAALVSACKKKSTDTAATGSAMAEGSAMAAVPPPAPPPAPGSDLAAGSAMGVGSGGSDIATTTGSAGMTDGTQVDPEGHRNWNCKTICKRAIDCKATSGMNEKTCEQDCTSLAKDKDGRYERGAGESARFYTCVAKSEKCADTLACMKPAK